MSEAIRESLLVAHRPSLEAALFCADAVVAGWDGETTADREAVAGPYETVLRENGLVKALLAASVEVVDAGGYDLAARPVADVPYVAVTAEGVIIRLSMPEGRIVVRLQAFERSPYRRGPSLPEAVTVEKRGVEKRGE